MLTEKFVPVPKPYKTLAESKEFRMFNGDRFDFKIMTKLIEKLAASRPELSEILISGYNQKMFGCKFLSLEGGTNNIWIIITFKDKEKAFEYGKKYNFPYAIHAFFEYNVNPFINSEYDLIGLETFEPMVKSFDTNSSEKPPVRIFVREFETMYEEKFYVIGTPSTGIDKAYDRRAPRKGIDPEVPIFAQVAKLLSANPDEGRYYLHNHMDPENSYLSRKESDILAEKPVISPDTKQTFNDILTKVIKITKIIKYSSEGLKMSPDLKDEIEKQAALFEKYENEGIILSGCGPYEVEGDISGSDLIRLAISYFLVKNMGSDKPEYSGHVWDTISKELKPCHKIDDDVKKTFKWLNDPIFRFFLQFERIHRTGESFTKGQFSRNLDNAQYFGDAEMSFLYKLIMEILKI